MTRRHFVFAPAVALAGCAHKRVSGFDGYAFVANAEGAAIAAVDLNTFTLAKRIPVDGSPSAVLAPQGLPAVYALTPAAGAVYEIDPGNLTVHKRLTACRTALSLAPAVSGPSLWLLAQQPRELVRIGTKPLRVEARIPLPLDPVDVDFSADGRSAAVSFGDTGKFGLVDLELRSCHVFDLGKKLSLIHFRSDGRQVLMAAAEEPLLSIAETRTGRLVVHLPLAVRARNFCMKSDGGQLFVTGDGMDAVVVVYPFTTEVSETVLAGRTPGSMAECASDGSDYLFLTNPSSGEVTVLDIESRKVMTVFAVGRGPCCIVPTPDTRYALVLNGESGDIAVIRVAAIAATRQGSAWERSAPLFTMVPVGSKPVSAAVRHA